MWNKLKTLRTILLIFLSGCFGIPLAYGDCQTPGDPQTSNLGICLTHCNSRTWCDDGHNEALRIDELFSSTNGGGGHQHTGLAGQGPQLGPSALASTNSPSNGDVPTFNSSLSTFTWGSSGALGLVPTTRSVNTGTGLTGGGNLSVDRTISFDYSKALSDNPPLNGGECIMSSNVGGLLCEGLTADTAEIGILFEDPTGGTDAAIDFPPIPGGSIRYVCMGGEKCTKGTGSGNVVIGNGTPSPSWNNTVLIGDGSLSTSSGGEVVIGAGATSTASSLGNSIILGKGALDNGSTKGCFAAGQDASCAHFSEPSTFPDAGEVVFGSVTGSLSTMYLGQGVSSSSPANVLISGTHANGSNITGGNISISGGAGTGTHYGGHINFETGLNGSSGSSLNAPATVWFIDGGGNLVAGVDGGYDIGKASDGTAGIKAPKDVYVSNRVMMTTTASGISWDGTTVDSNRTNLGVTDPTGTRTINLPDASGTVCLSGGDGCGTPIRWLPIFPGSGVAVGAGCATSTSPINTISCANNPSSQILWTITMPESFIPTGGTSDNIEVMMYSADTNGNPSGTYAWDFACAYLTNVNPTFSSTVSVNTDFTSVVSGDVIKAQGTLTDAGGSAAQGAMLVCSLQLNQVGTTVPTPESDVVIVGIKMGYQRSSFSDF